MRRAESGVCPRVSRTPSNCRELASPYCRRAGEIRTLSWLRAVDRGDRWGKLGPCPATARRRIRRTRPATKLAAVVDWACCRVTANVFVRPLEGVTSVCVRMSLPQPGKENLLAETAQSLTRLLTAIRGSDSLSVAKLEREASGTVTFRGPFLLPVVLLPRSGVVVQPVHSGWASSFNRRSLCSCILRRDFAASL